jgi:uncharacterized small protein (DUF1192 family)
MTNPRDPVKVPEEAAEEMARAGMLGQGTVEIRRAVAAYLTTREAALRAEIERLKAHIKQVEGARKADKERVRHARKNVHDNFAPLLERAERAEAQLAVERVALVDAAAADLTPEFKEKAKDLHPIDAAQLGYALAIMRWQTALAAGAEDKP